MRRRLRRGGGVSGSAFLFLVNLILVFFNEYDVRGELKTEGNICTFLNCIANNKYF